MIPPAASLYWLLPSSALTALRKLLMACVKWKLSTRSANFWPIPWITRTRSRQVSVSAAQAAHDRTKGLDCGPASAGVVALVGAWATLLSLVVLGRSWMRRQASLLNPRTTGMPTCNKH